MTNGSHAPEGKLDAPNSALDIEQIWYVIREKAWLIALCGIIGILGGLAYIHRTPLTYYTQATVEVDSEPTKVTGYTDGQEVKDPIGDQMGATLMAVFHSRQFAERVIKDNKLMDLPKFMYMPAGRQPTLDDAVGALLGMERPTLRGGTRFIDLGVNHFDPLTASKVADALASSFVTYNMEQREAKTRQEKEYLQKEAEDASLELKKAMDERNEYKAKNDALSLDNTEENVITDLRSKNTDLTSAHEEEIKLQSDYDQIQKHLGDADALLTIPSVANDPSIVGAQKQIDDIQSKIAVLKIKYTELHPKMIQARTQLANTEKTLKEDVLNIPSSIRAKLDAAHTKVASYSSAVATQQKSALVLDSKRPDFEVLNRKVETANALYEGILENLKKVQVATGIGSDGVQVFESAQVPVEPLQARKSKTLAIAFAAGLAVGLMLAFGLHMMDSSIKTVDQTEEILGLTVLAAVPRQPQKKLLDNNFAIERAPGSAVAEAFRTLRTAIYLAGRKTGRKVVLFTSALAGEGKTFCSTNYATALAQQGMRTLLIDADLRSPMIGNVVMPGKKVKGLADVLSGKASLEEAIHETEYESLWVLPAGELVPNPAELLARGGMGEYMQRLEESFDRIVIDTAPVTAVSDTLLLLEHAQALCLVFHAGKTPRKWVQRAIKVISEAGSKLSGVIVNQVPIGMAGAYSYYPGRYGDPAVYGSDERVVASRAAEKSDAKSDSDIVSPRL